MAVAEKTVSLQEKPEKVWAILSTMSNWDILAKSHTFRRTIEPKFIVLEGQAPGPGMRFKVNVYNQDIQFWEVDEWTPPRRFAASSRTVSGEFFALVSNLSFEIVPVNTLETTVNFRFELNFNNPITGPFLNLVFPTEWRLRTVLENVCKRLPLMLEDGA